MERDSPNLEGATQPTTAARPTARRRARDRTDPADARRRRWLTIGTLIGMVMVLVAYVVVTSGRTPDGPVRELPVFASAVDARDVDALMKMWDPQDARDDRREEMVRLFEQIGERGTTPRAEPPRIRRVDQGTFRAIHRIGEVDLESIWAWNGEHFHVTAVELAR